MRSSYATRLSLGWLGSPRYCGSSATTLGARNLTGRYGGAPNPLNRWKLVLWKGTPRGVFTVIPLSRRRLATRIDGVRIVTAR